MKRNRSWEKSHPVLRCWVPVHARRRAAHVHTNIKGLAEDLSQRKQGFFTTLGEVARVMLEIAWKDFEDGKLVLRPYPNPQGRKMRLEWDWETQEGHTRTIPAPQGKQGHGDMWIGYRMDPKDVTQWQERINRLAEQYDLSAGDVLTQLLQHGLHAYTSGRVKLRAVPVVTNWRIDAVPQHNTATKKRSRETLT